MDDDSVRANRAYWNAISDEYQATHDPQIGRAPKLWGAWSVPEQEVNALGSVAGLTVLELGCGAARWAMAPEADGAFAIGLDLSDHQLAAARRYSGRLRLVQGAGETLPFASNSFDLVLCDHGALSWANPHLTVPEVARVLVTGGRLVFNAASPWLRACYDERTDRTTTTLHRSYFDADAQAEGRDGARPYPRLQPVDPSIPRQRAQHRGPDRAPPPLPKPGPPTTRASHPTGITTGRPRCSG